MCVLANLSLSLSLNFPFVLKYNGLILCYDSEEAGVESVCDMAVFCKNVCSEEMLQ